MSSFSTGTKKKAKAPPPVTIESTNNAATLGSKLYEKIKNGMQVALGATNSSAAAPQFLSNSGSATGTPVI